MDDEQEHKAKLLLRNETSALTRPAQARHRCSGDTPGELREPAGDDRQVADQVADRILHTRRLKDLRLIKSQDRQALYLKALGFRYHEIAALLGITYTAVNRRITEGRRLRELEAPHDAVSRHSRTSQQR